MPTSGRRGSPDIKRKSTFQQELEFTLKDRKRRGLSTGFSDSADEDDSSQEGGEGLAPNDDLLPQFSHRSKASTSMSGSSWQPPSRGARRASPKPSPRGTSSQSPSPRTLTSLKLDSTPPIPHSRTRSMENPDYLSKEKKSTSLDRKKSLPSPDPFLALLGDSARGTDRKDLPKPKPRMRTSTSGSTDSPRSGEDLTPRCNENSSRPMPKPRGISPRSKHEEPSEIDKLLGITPSKSKSKRKTSNVDELLDIKPSRPKNISPSKREETDSAYDKSHGMKTSKGRSNSPGPRLKSRSPELKSKSQSPLDALLGNTGKHLLKNELRSKSPEELVGFRAKSKSKSLLDETLQSGNKNKIRGGLTDISQSKLSHESKNKAQIGSPVPLSDKSRKQRPDDDEEEDKMQELRRKNKLGRESPGENKTRTRESATIKQKNKIMKGVLDSSSQDESDDTDPRYVDQDRRKKNLPKPKPRLRERGTDKKNQRGSSPSEKSKKLPLLDSDSEEEDQVKTNQDKLSLLDALGDGKKGDGKKEQRKKKAMALLEDSDDEEEDVFRKHKNPPIISDRRPKGGYHSADSYSEEDTYKKKPGSGPKLVKPTAIRPSSANIGGRGIVSLDSSFNSTLSSLGPPGSTDITDSSTIRQAIFEDWKERKTQKLKQKKMQQRKKEKEEEKRKEKERNEKRTDATSSFEAWKETKKEPLKEQKKVEKKKKTMQQQEEEERMLQIVQAKKVFELWKSDKDEKLIEQHQKKKKSELMKTRTLAESKREKEKHSQSAFNRWKSDKDEYIIEKVREKKQKMREKQSQEEEAKIQQEELSVQAYEDWEQNLEQRKKQEKWRRMRSQPIATVPFRPCSSTIPFGR